MFLVTRLVTWLLAGREGSIIAGWTGELWTLDPLTAKEADSDAAELAPVLGELPPGVLRVLSFVGAPVLLAKRVSEKLRRKPRPEPQSKPSTAITPPTAAA